MTESAEHPLPGASTSEKSPKRRAPTARPRAAAKPRPAKATAVDTSPDSLPLAPVSPGGEAGEAAPAKPRTRKTALPRKTVRSSKVNGTSAEQDATPASPEIVSEDHSSAKKATPERTDTSVASSNETTTDGLLPGMESSALPGRRRPSSRKPKTAPHVGGQVEEWSPSRPAPEPRESRPAADKPSAPSVPAAPEPPALAHGAGTQTSSETTPAATAPARKYPVYIPRHVAKQMEEQGQSAPLAVSLDAVPENARAAVEAAQAAQAERVSQHGQRPERTEGRTEPRPDRGERHERGERPERGGRYERGDRGPRGDRGAPQPDRGPRGDRPDRPDRGDRFDSQRPPREDRGDLGESRVLPDLSPDEELGHAEGIVEISGKGFGFIRDAKRAFAQHPTDVFVTPEHVRRYNLRDGQWLQGDTRRGVRGAQLHRLATINGDDAEKARILPAFDELTVISPMERILMETTPERNTTRLIDLFTPIGKGQRGLIVAPPRTGKTTLLQHIADALVKHHPEITLIILLVDERPEEVTDIKRTLPTAEIMASSNDSDVKSHTRIAQLAIERAKRLVESGKDVFVLLDSITRVGRAFNNAMAGGGRTMSGGVDARALEIPRRLFAAARNTEEAGSLTIIATALIDTGSRMDELIFQEFKGTGNMEIVLDRKIADQRIYPAIDMFQSGTRREELLIPADDLHKINILRRGLAGHKPMEAIDRLLFFLRKFPTNAQMLKEIPG